jgi:hypothetical protein
LLRCNVIWVTAMPFRISCPASLPFMTASSETAPLGPHNGSVLRARPGQLFASSTSAVVEAVREAIDHTAALTPRRSPFEFQDMRVPTNSGPVLIRQLYDVQNPLWPPTDRPKA